MFVVGVWFLWVFIVDIFVYDDLVWNVFECDLVFVGNIFKDGSCLFYFVV